MHDELYCKEIAVAILTGSGFEKLEIDHQTWKG